MRVGVEQVEAMRAYLRGDAERFHQLLDGFDSSGRRAHGALIAAAFFTAGERRFSRAASTEIVEFVSRVRGRSEKLAATIEPRSAERLLLATVADEEIDDIDGVTQGNVFGPLLVGLILEAELSDAELDAFLEESRTIADRWLAD